MATKNTKKSDLELMCIPGREETDEGSWFAYDKQTCRSLSFGVGRMGREAAAKYINTVATKAAN